MKALMFNGALDACDTHDKKRTYGKPVRPRNKCPVCWCVYLSDHIMTSLYEEDMEAIFKFAGMKPTITYEETCNAED